LGVVIRLKRAGGKNRPFFQLVVCDSRMPRDGRFLENVGYYDPLTEPATIHVDGNKVANWVAKGAIPSETVRHLIRKAGAAGPAPSALPEGSIG
jgi:small subunit ribosomal protein S16